MFFNISKQEQAQFGYIKKPSAIAEGFEIVGVRGFEPPASSSRTKRATGLRYTPLFWDGKFKDFPIK